MNDTTRRFLTAIVERVPEGGRIVELRLFPAIRQGGMESGVAVVAVEPPAPAALPDDAAAMRGEGEPEAADEDLDSIELDGAVAETLDVEAEATAGEWTDGRLSADGEARADGDQIEGDHSGDPHARAHDRAADDGYAAAAHELVDTDIVSEEEEGASGDEVETPLSYIPNADTTDDDVVGDALDDEMNTIVVNASREVVAAESRVLAKSSGSDARSPSDALDELSGGEPDQAAVGAPTTEENAGAYSDGDSLVPTSDATADDSPYADASPPPDTFHRELLADVVDPHAAPADPYAAPAAAPVDPYAAPVDPYAGPVDLYASPVHLYAASADPDAMRLEDILALPSPDGEAMSSPDGQSLPSQDDAAYEAMPLPVDEPQAPPRTFQRYAILTASYRLTLKGPDRGKWDVEMTHEADAPLATVERVARGVAKRSGDESEAEHFSAESLKQALDAPAWIEAT